MSESNKKILSYFIVTFGCQMNKADSEKIAFWCAEQGFLKAKTKNQADLIIINTCSVRQSAEDRVVGLVINLCRQKNKPKIIVTGCMLRYPPEKLKAILPGVDKFIKLKDLVKDLPALRKKQKHAWVTIMEGCNNFCSYCVVPYARGREISRPLEEIIGEVEALTKQGFSHITLLGQNVNSYGKNEKLKVQNEKLQIKIKNLEKKFKNNFAILLILLNDIERLEKTSFLTSNPHDLTDEIIQVLKLPKIDRYLHLAVQSGDDEILQKMNRKYTRKKFIALINKIRKEIPGIQIGTDIIVGFPGETEKQFQNTVSLCRLVKFKVAYIARYSPRPQTAAFKLKDNVPALEKKRRWQILDKLINS